MKPERIDELAEQARRASRSCARGRRIQQGALLIERGMREQIETALIEAAKICDNQAFRMRLNALEMITLEDAAAKFQEAGELIRGLGTILGAAPGNPGESRGTE